LTWLVKVATTIGVAFGTTSFDFSLKKQSVGTNPERQMHVYGACQAISSKHKQQRHIMRSRSASAAAASAMRQGGLLHTQEQGTPTPPGQSTILSCKHNVIFARHRPLQARTAVNKFSDEAGVRQPAIPGVALTAGLGSP